MAMETEMNKILPIPYVGGIDHKISYKYDELVALCPVTGILDTYSVEIIFIPNDYIPELKTLKFYFLDYIDMPISHEHLHAKIFKDFNKIIKPKESYVILDVSIRGGIHTIIEYSLNKELD